MRHVLRLPLADGPLKSQDYREKKQFTYIQTTMDAHFPKYLPHVLTLIATHLLGFCISHHVFSANKEHPTNSIVLQTLQILNFKRKTAQIIVSAEGRSFNPIWIIWKK